MGENVKNDSGKMVCPKCGSNDVFWNGSSTDADANLYIGEMCCEDCNIQFGASFKLQYTEYEG